MSMRFSLRGVLATAFVLVMCGVCVRLGFWQLDRLQQRRARNHVQAQALRMPTLAYDSAAALSALRVTGTFDPVGELVLRGRADDGRPGVHLVTPLVVPGVSRALLVNRGWVPSPDAATVDARPWAEPGPRTVEGILVEIPRGTKNGGEPAAQRAPGGPATPSYRRLDLDVLRRVERRPIARLYLQQLPGADSASGRPPVRVPLQPMNDGPHLSYAFQWFSFAAIGLVGLVVVYLRRRRQDASAS